VSEVCDQISELVGSINHRQRPRLANHLQLGVGHGGGQPAAVFEGKERIVPGPGDQRRPRELGETLSGLDDCLLAHRRGEPSWISWTLWSPEHGLAPLRDEVADVGVRELPNPRTPRSGFAVPEARLGMRGHFAAVKRGLRMGGG
jgi:hypothetical protein